MSALERMLGEFAARPSPGPRQAAAALRLREASLPTRRDENWHYANLRALENLPHFAPADAAGGARASPALPAPLPGYARLVVQDGRLQPGSAPVDTEAVESGWPASEFDDGGDGRFGLVSQLFSAQLLALRISGRQSLEILHCASAEASARYADVAIEIAPGAQLELVERQLARPDSTANSATGFGCNRLRLRIGSGAQVRHTRLQQAEDTAVLFDTAEVRLHERASYRLSDIHAGAASARSTLRVVLAGADSTVQVVSLSAARDAQRTDTQYTVRHEAPRTRSDVLFRGSASDRGHVACTADVQVAPGAPGARVQQSLRGLIDGKGAEVDLRPRLTIDTDDIQASHGATTGRLDDDLLFYLLARGLAPEAARSLLKWAFLSEALRALEPQELRRESERATAARLTDAPAAELLQ